MRKLIGVIIVLIIIFFIGYFVSSTLAFDRIIPEQEKVSISEYYIYGDHLNIKGSLEIDDMTYEEIYLNIYDGEYDKNLKVISNNDGNKIYFYLSDYINDGFYLDNLERGNYYLFLKLIYENKDNPDKPIIKYYILDNKTNYDETTYYTMSKYNNKILINFDNKYNTMAFKVNENNEKNIYDITIDPGHGGMDSGGINGEYYESNFTMDISLKIKNNLEENGFKVKLTRDEGQYTKNDYFDEYNEHGRAVIPNEVKSKYTFSIHINKNVSKGVKGFEIYTPVNINYDFAKIIADNLIEYTELDYSTNKLYKFYNGIYSRNFTESDIASSLNGYRNKGYEPYELTTNSNYYYMIRETGGIITGAYVDDSNPVEVGVNPYYNSNVGNESYLLELGYISNLSDLSTIRNNSDGIAKAISDAIITKFNK